MVTHYKKNCEGNINMFYTHFWIRIKLELIVVFSVKMNSIQTKKVEKNGQRQLNQDHCSTIFKTIQLLTMSSCLQAWSMTVKIIERPEIFRETWKSEKYHFNSQNWVKDVVSNIIPHMSLQWIFKGPDCKHL